MNRLRLGAWALAFLALVAIASARSARRSPRTAPAVDGPPSALPPRVVPALRLVDARLPPPPLNRRGRIGWSPVGLVALSLGLAALGVGGLGALLAWLPDAPPPIERVAAPPPSTPDAPLLAVDARPLAATIPDSSDLDVARGLSEEPAVALSPDAGPPPARAAASPLRPPAAPPLLSTSASLVSAASAVTVPPDTGAGALRPLRSNLEPLFQAFPASGGIAVLDLQTGERIAINGDLQMQAASTIKFYVILSVLHDLELGRYTFADVQPDIWGVMVPQDNNNARNLTLRTGLRTVNERLRDWGIANTIITHPSGFPYENDPLYALNANLTTAADAVSGLALLYHAKLAAPETSRTMLEQFTQAPRWFGIEGAVPDGEGHVYYKVGWLPESDFSSVNDLGIVEFQRGEHTLAYAMAVYTQGAVPQHTAWVLVRDAALTGWEYFATVRYPLADGDLDGLWRGGAATPGSP